jgi:RNA polymerase sigma-70 factor (ECF subfamily)
MSLPSVHTVRLQQLVDRMRAGEPAARDELLRGVAGRLEGLARTMLRRFPDVGRWFQTDDVLQNALLRLLRALEVVRPESMRAFFGLAATQLRRELLDLARQVRRPHGLGAHHASQGPHEAQASPALEPAAPHTGDDELERWCRFHEEVERLPADEREVVSLIFYHGWTQAAVADLFQVHERTIRRWWLAAVEKLQSLLGDDEVAP